MYDDVTVNTRNFTLHVTYISQMIRFSKHWFLI